LLASLPLVDPSPAAGPGSAAGTGTAARIDTERFCKLLSADWGWWRTVTANLAKLPGLVAGRPELRFASPPLDPLTQAARLAELAEATPKGMKWRLRANIGDRVRWYELPRRGWSLGPIQASAIPAVTRRTCCQKITERYDLWSLTFSSRL